MFNAKILSCIVALGAGLAVAGCASYSGSHLVPGTSTVREVEATMGTPDFRADQSGGNRVWSICAR
jgi:hypothetical protein